MAAFACWKISYSWRINQAMKQQYIWALQCYCGVSCRFFKWNIEHCNTGGFNLPGTCVRPTDYTASTMAPFHSMTWAGAHSSVSSVSHGNCLIYRTAGMLVHLGNCMNIQQGIERIIKQEILFNCNHGFAGIQMWATMLFVHIKRLRFSLFKRILEDWRV